MNLLQKILLTSISFVTFIFLIFVTYLVTSYGSFEKPIYETSKLGIHGLLQNANGKFSIGDISDSTKIFVENINYSDKVVFSSGSISTKTSSGNLVISTTPGIYYFNLKELNTNYVINGTGFEIENKGPGSFFINSLDPKKNIVFSLNNILELNLKHNKTNEHITTVDLYPHTYLLFNPVKNIFVKNSDLLKISQTFNLGYFNNKIFNGNVVNEKFMELISLKNEPNYEMIKISIELQKQELENKEKVINNFINSKFGFLPGEILIDKYMSFLKNPKKKSIYYKNLILRNLNALLKSKTNDLESIQKIVDYMNKLEELNKNDYNEVFNIITYYYDSVLKSNPEVITKINISKLVYKIENPNLNTVYKHPSLINLEKTFFKYNFTENKTFYKEIGDFREKYFKEQNLITQGNSTNKSNTGDIKNIDYLLFFLENILISDFSSSGENANELITIFSEYVKLANSFYSNSDEKIKRTGIFTYAKILNNFSEIIETKYFIEGRSSNNLLRLNEDQDLYSINISDLEANINSILTFYQSFKNFLKPDSNNKDKFISKQFAGFELKFEEMFIALQDYEEYSVKYDKTKRELLDTETVNENNNDIILSENNAKKYLGQFNGIQLNRVVVDVMDYSYCVEPIKENEKNPLEVPYCYKIENLNIDSNNTSFLLYPFEKNKIDYITVEGNEKSSSYKLDEIKEILAEKIKAETKDKSQFEFTNFLINTFGQRYVTNNNNSSSEKDDPNQILEEDNVVKIFKRNKLLGNEGDFAHLSGFLDINYNDLIVIIINDYYSIDIKRGIFQLELTRNKSFYGEFASKYIFNPDHSFVDPIIKIMDKKNEKDLLLGNYVYIVGQYKVNLIQEEIKDVFEKYDQINYIVSNISQILRINNIKITYIKTTGQVIFETTYNSNKIKIVLDKSNISDLKINNVSQLGYKMSYTQIQNILNNIK